MMGNDHSALMDPDTPPNKLEARDLESVAKLIKDGTATRIVVMTGAGLSTAAGIPDFRSPETGLYANLGRLNLPSAESVFDIDYFRTNPDPFYVLAKELYPGNYQPTLSHSFISLLAKKGLLSKLFTQNIDCLERQAGVPSDLIVEAHGSFATQRCIDCREPFPDETMKEHVVDGRVPRCLQEGCNGLVKPDIVFFGESLPSSFFKAVPLADTADLVLIIGTSLAVQPFALLPERVPETSPRVLFNLEQVGMIGSRPDDVLALGDCDANICTLADHLGWLDELNALWRETVGEAEAERQLKRIRGQKKIMMAGFMDKVMELTKRVGETTLEEDGGETEGSSVDSEGSSVDSEGFSHTVGISDDSPTQSDEVVAKTSSGAPQDTAPSGAAELTSDDPLHDVCDTTAASQVTRPETDDNHQKVDVSHVGAHHTTTAIGEPANIEPEKKYSAEAFMAPVSAPHVHVEKKAEANDESATQAEPQAEAVQKNTSEDSHKGPTKPLLL